MINSETTAILLVVLAAFGILAWGFNRGRAYGKLGILAWLQSVVLMGPWLIFFALFAIGIYLNLATIIFLVVFSAGIYILLGKQLRDLGQNTLLQERAAKRLQNESEGVVEYNLKIVSPELLPIPDEELKKIQSIFGIDTFFATETISYQQGAIFKGNLRGEPDKVYPLLASKLKNVLGDKYRLFLVESPEEKPVVVILPSSNDPQPLTLAQKNLALVLLVATIFTSLESASILLGFDLFNNFGRYKEALPLSLGLWLVLIAHELGHWLAAKRYEIRLSWPFFLPTWQLGSFGAITRFASLLPHRTALFDISLAGPACSGIVSLVMLIVGLLLSHSGSLFKIPSEFFQGSILVGSLAKVVLGERLQGAVVEVHPLLVIGWLGLVITSLNLLPTGQLDGGRVVQAIYGRKTARRASIATLILLFVVALFNPGNPVPLYWAILIVFLQRDLERPSLNELSEVDDARAAWGLLALFLMLATLIPLSPALAGRLGIGG
jgi:membrane-associated protease RseP (regulator of RpoE activity)